MEPLLISAGADEQLPEEYVQKQHNARKEKAHYAEIVPQAIPYVVIVQSSLFDSYSKQIQLCHL